MDKKYMHLFSATLERDPQYAFVWMRDSLAGEHLECSAYAFVCIAHFFRKRCKTCSIFESNKKYEPLFFIWIFSLTSYIAGTFSYWSSTNKPFEFFVNIKTCWVKRFSHIPNVLCTMHIYVHVFVYYFQRINVFTSHTDIKPWSGRIKKNRTHLCTTFGILKQMQCSKNEQEVYASLFRNTGSSFAYS